MDKIYSAQDVANAIAKVEELVVVNAELEELLHRGSNNEKLVERKRELENSVRKYKPALPNINPIGWAVQEEDEELISLKADYDFVVARYTARKLTLEAEINILKNGC